MTLSLMPSIIIGFIWGLAISLLNNFLTYRALQKSSTAKVQAIFIVRMALNLIAMLLVYKNVPMLCATAVGLLTVKNYIFIKNLIDMRSQKKRGEQVC